MRAWLRSAGCGVAMAALVGCGACQSPSSTQALPSAATPGVKPSALVAPPASAEVAPKPAAKREETRPLGMGLSQVVEWGTQLPFINIVKQARPWTFHADNKPWGQGPRAEVDERGWIRALKPGQRAELIVLIAPERVPFDRFLVTWKGQGRFRYRGNARAAGPGPKGFRDLVQLTAPKGQHFFSIEISETNPKDPLRDFVIIPEVFLDNWRNKERFNPEWLARLRPFSVLRFMDWMQTNNSRQQRWSQRPKVQDLSYRARGVPIEVMVDLGNLLDADVWFNVPHLADDDYVRSFGELVKARLHPGRVAWFEHSNEVWNWMFAQAKYANATGRLRWRNKGTVRAALEELALNRTKRIDLSVLDKARMQPDLQQVEADIEEYGLQRRLSQVLGAKRTKQDALRYVLSRQLGTAPGNAYMQHNGVRAAQICDILKKQVFAAELPRVRCVVGAQTANHGLAEVTLQCPNWSEAPCVDHGIDAIAIAGYVGHDVVAPANATTLRSWSQQGASGAAAVVAELTGARKLPQPPTPLARVAQDFAYYARVAKKYGLQLVAYEGGQHLVASHVPSLRKDKQVLQLLEAANGHPDMGGFYFALLDAWKAAGGGLFIHYVDASPCSKSGCWGALEAFDQDAPKYDALVKWSRENPRWWAERR